MKKQTKLGLVLAAAAVISVSVASLVSARGWVQNGADWYYVDNNNEYVTDTIQSSGTAKFYLGEDGAMQRDYFLEDYNEQSYYFGQNGAMVTNTWVAIESSRVENQDDYVPDNYWYYFQSSGKAAKGSSGTMKKMTIDGKRYAFNEYGQMCIGWIGPDGKTINPDDDANPFANAMYYAGGDNDGVLRSGWVTYYDGYDEGAGGAAYASEYAQLYFYFNPTNNRKFGMDNEGGTEYVTKKINGRTYAFNNEGVMTSGWDVYNERDDFGFDENIIYFSKDDDGHQVKKGWVYAVPAQHLDGDAYQDDEEKYMYFASSGDIVKDQFKKINGKFYAFNRTGIMKTGIVIWCADGETQDTYGYKYIDKIDLDWAEGADIAKKGRLRFGDDSTNKYIQVDVEGRVINAHNDSGKVKAGADGDYVKLHYFGDDGSRRTGANNIEFADDTYTLQTTASGDKGSGIFSKKYYSLGILLKASPDIRYGIYNAASPTNLGQDPNQVTGLPLGAQYNKQTNDFSYYYNNLINGNYTVLTTGGARQKGNRSAKKDADGNYWVLDADSGALRGIWTVNIKQQNTLRGGNFSTRSIRDSVAADAGIDTSTWVSGTTTATPSTLAALGLYVSGSNNAIENTVWTYHHSTTNATMWFTKRTDYYGPVYQSDYDDKQKWIPLGMTDNSKKTVVFDVATYGIGGAQENPNAMAYFVKPTNDYFLNCYWTN